MRTDVDSIKNQFHSRVLAAEARDEARDQAVDRRPNKADAQATSRACCGISRRPQQLLAVVKQAPRLHERGFAAGGEQDAGRCALEQPGTEFALQLLDRDGQCRLGNVQPLGRPTEVEGLGKHVEVADATQVHRRSVVSAIKNTGTLRWGAVAADGSSSPSIAKEFREDPRFFEQPPQLARSNMAQVQVTRTLSPSTWRFQ